MAFASLEDFWLRKGPPAKMPIGVPFQGASGKWYIRRPKDGHIVPTKAPGTTESAGGGGSGFGGDEGPAGGPQRPPPRQPLPPPFTIDFVEALLERLENAELPELQFLQRELSALARANPSNQTKALPAPHPQGGHGAHSGRPGHRPHGGVGGSQPLVLLQDGHRRHVAPGTPFKGPSGRWYEVDPATHMPEPTKNPGATGPTPHLKEPKQAEERVVAQGPAALSDAGGHGRELIELAIAHLPTEHAHPSSIQELGSQLELLDESNLELLRDDLTKRADALKQESQEYEDEGPYVEKRDITDLLGAPRELTAVPARVENALLSAFGRDLDGGEYLYGGAPLVPTSELDPLAQEQLQKFGLLKPAVEGTDEVQTLSDRGKLLYARLQFPGGIPKTPTTRKEVNDLASLYQLFDNPDLQTRLNEYLELDPRLAGMQVRQELLDRADKHHNPTPVQKRIKQDEGLQGFVEELGAGASKMEEHRKLVTAVKKRDKLRELIEQGYATTPTGLGNELERLDKRIADKQTDLSASPSELSSLLNRKQSMLKAFTEYWQQAGEVDKLRAQWEPIHQEVSKQLRSRVTQPAPVEAAFDPALQGWERGKVGRAQELLQGAIQQGSGKLDAYKVIPTSRGRSSYRFGAHTIVAQEDISTTTAIHEFLHGVEGSSPEIHTTIRRFLKERTGGEKPQKLANLFPDSGYYLDEEGVEDDFAKAFDVGRQRAFYTGKQYSVDNASEVLTMGGQLLFEDPAGFARRDPEFCALVVGLLDGSIRNKPIPER